MATAFANLLISKKRYIGGTEESNGIRVDGFIEENFLNSARVTTNPVEDGRVVGDGVIVDPLRYSMKGVITDTPLGAEAIVALGNTIGGVVDSVTGIIGSSESSGLTRSKQGYEGLLEMLNNKELISVTTSIKKINNLIFESLSVDVNVKTANSIHFSATFVEVLIVGSSSGKISPEGINGEPEKSAYSSTSSGGSNPVSSLTATEQENVFASMGGKI